MTAVQGITLKSCDQRHRLSQSISQFLWRFWEASATHNLCVLQVTVTASKNQVLGDLGVCHGLLQPQLVCSLWVHTAAPEQVCAMKPRDPMQTHEPQGQETARDLDFSSWLHSAPSFVTLEADGLPSSAVVCAHILPGLSWCLFSSRNTGQGGT